MKKPILTRRRLGIILLIVFLLLVAYAWLSAVAWRNYEDRLTSQKKDYQSLADTISSAKTTRADRVKAISQLSQQLNKTETGRCDQAWPYSWQSAVVPLLHDGVQRCKTADTTLKQVQAAANALNDYLASESKVENVLAKLSAGSINEADLTTKGLNGAKAVQNDLESLKATDSESKVLLNQAKTLVASLVSDWNGVINANKAKDMTAYTKAATKLSQDYANLGELADTSDNTLLKLVQGLKQSQKAL